MRPEADLGPLNSQARCVPVQSGARGSFADVRRVSADTTTLSTHNFSQVLASAKRSNDQLRSHSQTISILLVAGQARTIRYVAPPITLGCLTGAPHQSFSCGYPWGRPDFIMFRKSSHSNCVYKPSRRNRRNHPRGIPPDETVKVDLEESPSIVPCL